MKKKQKTNSINISILIGATVLAIGYLVAKSVLGMTAESPVVAEIGAPAPAEEARIEPDGEPGPLVADPTRLPEELEALGSKTFPLYRANFGDLWKTGHYSSGKKAVTYSGEPFGDLGSSLYMKIQRSDYSIPENLQVDLDFTFAKTKSYTTEFYTKLVPGSNYNAWVRLHTNVSDKGYYEISFHPQTQAYELTIITNGSRKILRTGHSSSINKNDAYNFVKVVRNPTTGLLKVFVNSDAKPLYQINNKVHVGGYSRLVTTSYSQDTLTMFTKFLVY